jgi:hypothetical protein
VDAVPVNEVLLHFSEYATNQDLAKKRNSIRSTASMIRLKPQRTRS